MVKTVAAIEGMMCGMCEAHMNDAIRGAFKVKKVESSHSKNQTVIISENPIDEQKLKDNDEIINIEETDNLSDLIFVTDKSQIYRAKTADFDCCKASAMGEYLPAKLGMDDGEKPIFMRVQKC